MKFLMSRAFPGEELLDFDKRLAFMDKNWIDMQVLSLTSPVSDLIPPEEAVRVCRITIKLPLYSPRQDNSETWLKPLPKNRNKNFQKAS